MNRPLALIVLVCAFLICASAALAQAPPPDIENIAPNPSFEQGAAAPAGWLPGPTGAWAHRPARSGRFSLASRGSPGLAGQAQTGRMRGAFGAYGEVTAGALAAFALSHPQETVSGKIAAALRQYRVFCETTCANPFGLAKQSVGATECFFEPTSTLGHNFEILGRAWAAGLIARLNGDERALRYAADQIDWVLGKNPIGLCMFEGVGTFNPPRYHHRYDAIPGRERGAVPGAIPNGFVRSAYGLDQPGFDLSRVGSERPHPSYRTSEPWLVHNMYYLLALSALSER